MDEREARMGWAMVAEPADAMAHLLTEKLGVIEAWAWLKTESSAVPVTGREGKEIASRLPAWRARLASCKVDALLPKWLRAGHRFLIPSDLNWPLDTDSLEAVPFGLWFIGNEKVLEALPGSVALVGARAATRYGEQVATQLAYELSQKDVVTISGGAYGIDAAAHRGALAGGGSTLSVQAGGLDRLYPQLNAQMFSQIQQEGGILSQIGPGGGVLLGGDSWIEIG
ncbi:hypothetical protein HMPREF3152_05255 [Actinomyces sp. HMSC06A08]|nr:hypothetical protein HMPREF3152_05255 [Actinomyces sp. HMSC06A08]